MTNRSIRSRLADYLLGDQKAQLRQAATILTEAYQRGPLLMSPEQLVERLSEVDSRYIDVLARQIQYGAPGANYQATETDRLRTVDASRRQYDSDVLTEAIIDIWTDFGFGVNLEVVPRDEQAREVWKEFFEAPVNSYVFSQRDIQRLSLDVLKDGDFLFVLFVSTLDGQAVIRKVPTHELRGGLRNDGIITLPDDRGVPVLYRREVGPTALATGATDIPQYPVLYYRDWRATDAMVEAVMPKDAYGQALTRFGDGPLAEDVRENTEVVGLLAAHRVRELRGWPMMTTGLPWSAAYKDMLQDRAALAKAAAMYFDKIRAKGGRRAIDAIVSSLQSSLAGSSSRGESNPPPAAGSTWVENEQLERSRFPQGTGAGDAATDSAALMAQAGLAGRVYPHYLGRGEAFRLATATSMEAPTFRAFNRYQLFWSSVWSDMARIVLVAAERYGRPTRKFSTYAVDVNTDALLSVDVQAVNTVADIINGLVAGQTLPQEVAQQIVPHLLRVAMQSLGIRNASEILPAQAAQDPTKAARVVVTQGDAGLSEAQLAEARPFGPDAYRGSLRQAVRALWSGQVDADAFGGMMSIAIRRGLTDAWYAGAEEAGVAAEELSPEELAALQDAIVTERGYADGFGAAITAGSKAAGGKLADFDARLDEWARRWEEAKTRGRIMANADGKSRWDVDADAEHCASGPDTISCLSLAGKVKRNSVWTAAGLYPRCALVTCSVGCLCTLTPTNEPVTRGPLPRVRAPNGRVPA